MHDRPRTTHAQSQKLTLITLCSGELKTKQHSIQGLLSLTILFKDYLVEATSAKLGYPVTTCRAHHLVQWCISMSRSTAKLTNKTESKKKYYASRLHLILRIQLGPFYHLTFNYNLDVGSTWTNISNGNSLHQGEQLYQIILKSMYICGSYGQDKLNLWPF